MPEHVHLLVSEPRRATLDRAIQALKTSVAKQSEQRPFWLARYYDFNVHSSAKKTEKLRYIHRNPVTRGLVTAGRLRWSSFRHYSRANQHCRDCVPWTVGRRLGLKVLVKTEFRSYVAPSHPSAKTKTPRGWAPMEFRCRPSILTFFSTEKFTCALTYLMCYSQ